LMLFFLFFCFWGRFIRMYESMKKNRCYCCFYCCVFLEIF
jgi:hypothetical protein